MIFAGVIVELALAAIQYQHSIQKIAEADEKYSLIGPLNPLIALASVLIFTGFAMLEVKSCSTRLASKTFLIYLLHAGVWDIMVRAVRRLDVHYSYIIILVCVVLVAVISYLLSIVYEVVWSWIEKKTNISRRIANWI